MANVHMKLRGWTANARHDPTAGVVVVDDTVEDILIVIRIQVVLVVEMPRLTVGEVIVGMRARKTQRREESWENVEDDEHCSVQEKVQQDASPNQVYLEF